MVTVIRIHYGTLPLFINLGCENFLFPLRVFLAEYGWKFDVLHNSCPVETIDETAETIKTEIMGMFWNWMKDQNNNDLAG